MDLLDIPPFLIRPVTETETVRGPRKKKRKPIKLKPGVKLFHGYVSDELAPACGCGYRTVEAKIGRKWVYVVEHIPFFRPKKKISLKTWNALRLEPK